MPKQAKYCQACTSLGTILKTDTAPVGINFPQFQAFKESSLTLPKYRVKAFLNTHLSPC